MIDPEKIKKLQEDLSKNLDSLSTQKNDEYVLVQKERNKVLYPISNNSKGNSQSKNKKSILHAIKFLFWGTRDNYLANIQLTESYVKNSIDRPKSIKACYRHYKENSPKIKQYM